MPHVYTFSSKAVFNFSFQACFALMVPLAGCIRTSFSTSLKAFQTESSFMFLNSKMSNGLQPCTLGAIKQSGLDWKSSCPPSHCGVFFMERISWRNTGFGSDASRRALESQVLSVPNLAASAWSCYFCCGDTSRVESTVYLGPLHGLHLEGWAFSKTG